MGRTSQLQEKSIFNVPLGEAAEGPSFQSRCEEVIQLLDGAEAQSGPRRPRELWTPGHWQLTVRPEQMGGQEQRPSPKHMDEQLPSY